MTHSLSFDFREQKYHHLLVSFLESNLNFLCFGVPVLYAEFLHSCLRNGNISTLKYIVLFFQLICTYLFLLLTSKDIPLKFLNSKRSHSALYQSKNISSGSNQCRFWLNYFLFLFFFRWYNNIFVSVFASSASVNFNT